MGVRGVGPLLSVFIAVAVFYGGLIFGLLPLGGYVSWEGHLAGLIGGVLLAWISGRDRS